MAYNEYLQDLKTKGTPVKVFLSNKTMLEGKIVDFDDFGIILDKCLVIREQAISIVPR